MTSLRFLVYYSHIHLMLLRWESRFSWEQKFQIWNILWGGTVRTKKRCLSTGTWVSSWRGWNCEIRPGRPNGPISESKMPTSTCPTKVGPILLHGPPVRTKAQTCPTRFKKLVLQAREACPASLRGLFSRSEWLTQQVCEACSARRGGRASLL